MFRGVPRLLQLRGNSCTLCRGSAHAPKVSCAIACGMVVAPLPAMTRALAFGLIAVGIVLLVLGINSADSVSSEVKEFFEGTPTDKSIWLLIGGVLALVVGLGALFAAGRRRAA